MLSTEKFLFKDRNIRNCDYKKILALTRGSIFDFQLYIFQQDNFPAKSLIFLVFAELKIHVSPQTKNILDKFKTFDLKKRRKSVALKVSYVFF